MVQYNFSRVINNFFLLGTLSLDAAAWVILFAAACAFRTNGLVWWLAFFELFFLLGTVFLLITDQIWTHRLAFLGFLVYSIATLTNLAAALDDGFSQVARAALAGVVILLLVQFVWVFAFGSEQNGFLSQYTGLYNEGVAGAGAYVGGKAQAPSGTVVASSAAAAEAGLSNSSGPRPVSTLQENATYNIQAKALYSYTANPDDPNEISFEKDEILSVSSTSGKWWQVRKADGSVGIAPSNYLQLI
ncbi:uncharacterized protein VTP21DRAFT_3878 [Calcarisporiella thermophila]|uniref:uncharacterized protein n=1 Tax=Calcarisporiella thermophila TaxID=911321 RepID=UPI003742A8B8